MNSELISLERKEVIACVTITREQKMNALSRATLAALGSAFDEIATMPEVRCVVLRSTGNRFFAAGGDVVELTEVKSEAEINAMADHARGALDRIRDCAAPVVAVLNGDAIGGGAELAVSCDFRIMRIGTHIGFIQGKLAINSAWGGGADLNALVGPARSLRMMTRCEMIDARTALDWGLADVVADAEMLEARLEEFIEPITKQSAGSLRAFLAQSRAHRQTDTYALRRQLERGALLETWPHPDHWAAVEKFLSRKR